MNFKKYLAVGALALALLMSGCSGGSSGGGGGTASTTSTQSVSGSVTLSSLASGAAAKSVIATTAVMPVSATINIYSYNNSDKLIDSQEVVAGSEGVFATQIKLNKKGGYIVIEVKSPNTSGWSKRISYTDPANIDVNAEVRAAQTVVQNVGTPITASAENGTFKFGVVRYADGSRKAVAGSAAIAAAKAATGAAGMDLEIDIPAGALPNTTTLQANLNTFDPSDDDDAQNFPGDYIDQSGNRLVSVGFDSIEITDEEGNSVSSLAGAALAAGTASKSAANDVTVRRWIPSGTCQSVNDFWTTTGPDGVANGNTIPIYTYNPVKGVWDLLGSGTVQIYDSGTGGYTDVGTFVMGDCTAGAYYLNILVSSEDYINAWWNLDYPLLTSQPEEVCVDLAFADAAGGPVSGLYAELSGAGVSRVSGSSRTDGSLRLSAIVTGSTAPTTGTVGYWNPYDYSYQTVTSVPVGTTCGTQAVTVTKPRICKVTGTVTKSGSPLANEYVWAYSANPYAYGWAYTGSDGKFSMDVRCDVEMGFYLGSTQTKTFRVDNIKTTDEVTDDGTEVALGSMAKANTAPYVYGYLSSYSILEGTTVTAYVYGWDGDGAADYPLSYVVKGAGADKTGTLAQSDGYKPVSLSGLTAGTYNVSLEVTDQVGAKGTVSLGTLEVSSGNRPPVISYAYASTGTGVRLNRDGTLPPFNLNGYAYDPDGNALTLGWTCVGCADALPAGSSVTFPGGAGYTADTSLTFTYTANDGQATVTRNVVVNILPAYNNTPYFTTVSQSATNVTAVPASIDFVAEAADVDVGDVLSYQWTVNGEPVTATGGSYTLDIPANAIDGASYTVMVEVTDGLASISHTFTATYQTATSDTTVILQ